MLGEMLVMFGASTAKVTMLLVTPPTVTDMLFAPITAPAPILTVTTMADDELACAVAVNPGGRLTVGDDRNPDPAIVI
jgi:hypothetical protein